MKPSKVETKFMRLRHPVTIGSYFGDWRVCWLGGWDRCRVFYLVMLEKVAPTRSGRSSRPTSFRSLMVYFCHKSVQNRAIRGRFCPLFGGDKGAVLVKGSAEQSLIYQ